MISENLLIHTITHYKRTYSTNPYGEREEQFVNNGTISCRISPLSEELRMYPAGEFKLGSIRIFLNDLGDVELGDHIEWNGQMYKIIEILPMYGFTLHHYELIATPIQ